MTFQDTRVDTPSITSAEGNADDRPAATDRILPDSLVLKGEPERCQRLWTSTIAAGSRSKAVKLSDTYFDTSDHRLGGRGFTLRVRREGGCYRQTVSADADGLAGAPHGEWSTPIAGRMPQLASLGSPEVLERIGLVLPGELQPAFTVNFTRRVHRYRVDGTADDETGIDATLDTGEIVHGETRRPFCEIALTLIEGPPGALQSEAVRLLRAEPLELEVSPIERRGFGLALDEHPVGRKAEPQRFDKRVSTDEALGAVLANCARHLLANHDAAMDGRDVEGIHQMRVAIRRLRSAATIFKTVLPADDVRWLEAEAKSLIDVLGAARDWDVFVDELLRPVILDHPDDANLAALQTAVRKQRRLAHDQVQKRLRSPAHLAFVLQLLGWIEGRGWRREETASDLDRPLVKLADQALRKRHRKALKLGRHFDDLPDESLHELRIAMKKLRYCAEFFAPLYPKKRARPYLAALHRLQDDLGYLNDVAVAGARLSRLCAGARGKTAVALQGASGLVLGWYSHALSDARPRIACDWHAFAKAKPFWHQSSAGGKP